MSVLKSRRRESAGEYVNLANNIYEHVLWFLIRLSNRYQRLLASDVMKLASEVLDYSEKANNITVGSDQLSYDLRKTFLINAKVSVMALDVHMSHIWNIIQENPQGCFTNTKGNTVSPQRADEILNKMADKLGNEIDEFKNKVTALLRSDNERFKKAIKSK